MISDHGMFFQRGPTRSGEQERFVGLFKGCTVFCTAGCWPACRRHQLKASTTFDLNQYFNFLFLFSVCFAALRNLG